MNPELAPNGNGNFGGILTFWSPLSWVSESFRRDIGQISTWKFFFLWKDYLFMKNLTDFHKTVEAGVDPRLIVKFLATHWAHQLYSYLISSNNSLPSINRLPRIITPLWRKYLKNNRLPRIIAPLPLLSPSSLPFIPSLSGWSAMRFSKTDQWRFQLWKLIKELNLEH